MQNTTNYNLKKPDYTDFADIADINDNMDTIDAQLAAPTGDSADSTTTFTTSDTADGGASSWTNVPALTSGETHKSLFAKMSQMFKNIRYLYKMLGTTDISSIGNGTVTNALSVLNANKYDRVTTYIEPNSENTIYYKYKSVRFSILVAGVYGQANKCFLGIVGVSFVPSSLTRYTINPIYGSPIQIDLNIAGTSDGQVRVKIGNNYANEACALGLIFLD